MEKIFISEELGSVYWLEGDTLMFAPIGYSGVVELEGSPVELDLIGSEEVPFRGVVQSFTEIAEIITKELQGVCPICGGEGEVPTDVLDPDSGRYMSGVGTQKCVCQLEEE